MLQADGWRLVRQNAGHRPYHHASKSGTVTVAGKVVVIIDEVDPDNWGEGAEQVTAIRKRRQAESSGGKP